MLIFRALNAQNSDHYMHLLNMHLLRFELSTYGAAYKCFFFDISVNILKNVDISGIQRYS